MAFTLNVVTRTTGPLFRGLGPAKVDLAIKAVQKEIADYALFQWRLNLENSWKNPTGRYMSATNIIQRELDLVVNDGYPGSGILYGPWLEGLGSRNYPVTRFKGYSAMRHARNQVANMTPAIAKPIIDKFTTDMNGA